MDLHYRLPFMSQVQEAGGGWLRRHAVLLAMPLVFVVLFLRGDAIFHPAQPVWDDKNFITEGILHGGPLSWFRPYVGYIHFLPRLLSDWFTIFNLAEAPWWAGVFSLMAASWAFALILSPAFDHLLPLRYRAILTAAMALMPWHTEVYAAICNMHWYLIVGLYLLALADYERLAPGGRILIPIMTAAVIFTTANCVLVFPVLLVRLLAEARKPRSYAFRYVLGSAALIIIYTIMVRLVGPGAAPGAAGGAVDPVGLLKLLVKGVGYKIVEQSLFGIRLAENHLAFPAAFRTAFAVWAIMVVVSVAWAFRRDSRRMGFLMLAMAYFTVATVLFAGLMRSTYIISHFVYEDRYFGADRYFVPPVLFFYFTVLWLLHRLLAHGPGWLGRPLAALLAAGFIAAAAHNFNLTSHPDYQYRASVLDYYEALLNTKAPATSPSEFRIVVHPPAKEWNMVLPLHELGPVDRAKIQRLLRENGRLP